MADLAFVQQHNMVAYLEKNDGNADFHQILDFLTSSSINFALTVSPTIYASYIEQFWNTASLKTINSEKQIHAKVNGKAVVVSESSVRRDLHLNDEDGTACLTVNEIFENLALMGYETASDKLTFYKERFLFSSVEVPNTYHPSLLKSLKIYFMGSIFYKFGFFATATASQPPKDLNTYMRTKRGQNTKVPQSGGSPKKVGDEAINEEMFDTSPSGKGSCMVTLGTKKPWGGAPAQNRSERVLEQPIEPPLSEGENDKANPMLHESDFDGFDDETVDAATTGVSTASAPVTTVGVAISTAEPRTPPTTTTVFDDEDVTMAMAQTLIKMKEEKAKEKGVAFKDVEDSSRPVRSITTLQPLPSIDPKDKGKELAHRLHEEESAEIERIQKEKAAQEELQQEDREQYIIKERAKFLAETIAAQRKFRVAQRAAEIRSRPPIKTQLRNLMMTYLKNMGGYKHSQLKGKTYEEIQGLYEREQKFIHDFIPMDSEKEEKKSMEPESEGKKSKRLKRIASSYAIQKSPKKPKVMKSVKNVTEEEAAEYEKEKEELGLSLKIIFGDNSEVNYETLSRRFPIVNWEYKLLGNVDAKDMYVYKLTRADGSSSYHGDMQALLRRLDSCGVYTLFMDGTPMEINMLVEKKYPLINELLEKMLNLQLEAEEESIMAFELIKFIKSMLEE
ncbi:hypothetical protein Tco_0251054 [Tanacetum coccineum]